MVIGVGDPAPDFRLAGTRVDGGVAEYSLADFAGHVLVLAFYPGDGTSVCTKQLADYNAGLDVFDELDARVVGISPQGVESHQRFAAEQRFRFPLLADTDKAVARAYGTLGPLGFPRRSVFIVDGAGVVRYAHRAIAGLTFRPAGELAVVLRTL